VTRAAKRFVQCLLPGKGFCKGVCVGAGEREDRKKADANNADSVKKIRQSSRKRGVPYLLPRRGVLRACTRASRWPRVRARRIVAQSAGSRR
jgi:hypothetical protein